MDTTFSKNEVLEMFSQLKTVITSTVNTENRHLAKSAAELFRKIFLAVDESGIEIEVDTSSLENEFLSFLNQILKKPNSIEILNQIFQKI